MPVRTKEHVFTLLRDHQQQLRQFGVKRLGLFGSFVRQQQGTKRDVDVLVEFEPERKTFDAFMQLAFFLEDYPMSLHPILALEHVIDEYRDYLRTEFRAKDTGLREALEYLCRCLLDEMRVRSALSREMLRYHPAHPSCPAHVRAAEWERRVKQPHGYAATNSGAPLAYLETAEIPAGITNRNAWRRPKAGGRGPSLERILRHLLSHFGGVEPDEGAMVAVLNFLRRGRFIVPEELFGYRDRRQILQVNAENVLLVLLAAEERVRCNVCGLPMSIATAGFPCPQAGATPRPVAIATAGQTEVLRLIVPVPASVAKEDFAPWGLTLGYALRIGMRHLYMLDGSEIDFELEGPWPTGDGESRLDCMALTFIDPSLGGTGYLDRAAEDFHLVARRAFDHLDHPDCETACYRCLKSYTNQRFHDMLRWPLAVPHIEVLAAAPPEPQPRETGDIDDPGPWLEAYAEGLGSPLELRFFRLFEAHGFHPEKQVPVAPTDGERPISVADFAVPEHRLAIYIDGASVHVGSNLRRDRHIRNRLRNGNPPWRVEELRAQHLSEGRRLVERLRTMAP